MTTEAPAVFHPMLQTVEVVLFAERGNNQRRNVIHYRYPGGQPSSAAILGVLGFVRDTILPAQRQLVGINTNWYEITGRDMASEDAATATLSVTVAGAVNAAVMPSNSSYCLSKRTARAGKSFRGRFYLFDLPTNFFLNDLVTGTYSTQLLNMANALLAAPPTTGWLPAVGSRRLAGSTPISAISYDNVADSQYRRLQNRGA